jgi:hypothetical protein
VRRPDGLPDSEALQPLPGKSGHRLGLVNVAAGCERDPLLWSTIRHNETGQERQFAQHDYLLVPEFMSEQVENAWLDRRSTRPTEADGSDHDPVLCDLSLWTKLLLPMNTGGEPSSSRPRSGWVLQVRMRCLAAR